ncbi:PREDICTED: uncharacterized protein LOC109172212 [Ipomoea nil]|uniref:uncharacterized protein LOC109172212 n=1 Tax=Ipomoea nil TaxID=35883 RepID=UPI000901CCBA|nr:PREDICTED: uncharacterized protein LOC109172212 [Ipomoea nil]
MVIRITNRVLGKFRRECEWAKRALSSQHQVGVEVESLFDGDKIKFSLSPSKSKDSLSTNAPGMIIKALNLYRKKTGTDKHFWIHLDKKVPTGAGLGGGSSNAATAYIHICLHNLCDIKVLDCNAMLQIISQGITSVVLAELIISAFKVLGRALIDQNFLFLGAGGELVHL